MNRILTEREQSLKKKIFSLPKMEALVFSDPKLSAVYDEMAENGEERYGYHYNETIMNMIFNDYVLNSVKYLQKYKAAIPKKKKRRDKSGINQLKQQLDKTTVTEELDVESYEMEDDDCFISSNGSKYSVSCGGKFIKDVEEMNDALAIVKNWKETNKFYPNTWFISDHGNPSLIDDEGNIINETTTAGSAGGSAGYTGYATPKAWAKSGKPMKRLMYHGGTLVETMGDYLTNPQGFQKICEMLDERQTRNPNIHGITNGMEWEAKLWDILETKYNMDTESVVEFLDKNSSYIQDRYNNNATPDDVSKELFNKLNENITKITSVEQLKALGRRLTKEDIPNLSGEALYKVAVMIANKMLPVSWDDLPDINSMWDYINKNGGMTKDELFTAVKEAVEDRLSESDIDESRIIDEKSVSKAQQKFMGMVRGVQTGEINPSDVGKSVRDAAKNMKKSDVLDFAKTKHDDLPNKVDETNDDDGDRIVEYVRDIPTESPFMAKGKKWEYVMAKYSNGKVDIGVYSFGSDIVYGYKWFRRNVLGFMDENNIKEQTMIDNNETSMKNKQEPINTTSSSIDMGTSTASSLTEINQFEQTLSELETVHNKLRSLYEDRKTSSMVMKDRIGKENEKNFKSDLNHSGTMKIVNDMNVIDEKNKENVVSGKISEKTPPKEFKNVGNSANLKGDEITKRNMTEKEADEVDLLRKGMEDWDYDNEVGERFEQRMKTDMGDEMYKKREEKLKAKSEMPMYNKDVQPTTNRKINETVVGSYYDEFGKKKYHTFKLTESREVKSLDESYSELDLTGMGNVYLNLFDNENGVLNENADIKKYIESFKFYIKENNVYYKKKELNESVSTEKQTESFDKVKHLMNYNPRDFIKTR